MATIIYCKNWDCTFEQKVQDQGHELQLVTVGIYLKEKSLIITNKKDHA